MTEIIDEWATNISYTTIEDYVVTMVDKKEPLFLPNVIVKEGMRGSSNHCDEVGFCEIYRGNKSYTQAFLAILHESPQEEYYQVKIKSSKNFAMDSAKIESILTLDEYYDMCYLLNEKPSKVLPSVKDRFWEFRKYSNAYATND